jgi:phosphoribosylaminoimidazole-succinocarboxamide synthase
MKSTALLQTTIEGYPKRAGKVRDIYDLPQGLLIVATDRISAYDVVIPNGIPDKGRVLTQISLFWFDLLKNVAANHVISADVTDLPQDCRSDEIDGRFILCRKCTTIPIECVVRGYLAGSGWREYKQAGSVCGVRLPPKLKESAKLDQPIFTPATKAEEGHDENISFERACEIAGAETMEILRSKSIAIYNTAHDHAAERGIILADTKLEWGFDESGRLTLIDELLTPDSSRFWPADAYKPGRGQQSFDKQFVRDYLDKVKFDRTPPAPPLPVEIVQQTRAKYVEAFEKLTGRKFLWE